MLDMKCKYKFNGDKVIADSWKATPKSLMRAGAYIWGVAKKSIGNRKNPDKANKPGRPPYAHEYDDERGHHPGFKPTLQFALSWDKRSVVIGPRYIKRGLDNAMRLNEYGGTIMVKKIDDLKHFKKGFRKGETGPVTVSHLGKNDRIKRDSGEIDTKTGRKIVYIKLRTKAQVEHSTRLLRRMVKQSHNRVMAHYPPRPFMRPALKRGSHRISRFWQNTLGNFKAN